MNRSLITGLLIFALVRNAALADMPVVEILDSDPPAGSTLHANEPLYLRLQYRSEQPLRFQVSGFLEGAKIEQSASYNPAPEYPAGSGEAIAWIAYYEMTDIDELQVIVSDPHWKTLDKLPLPMALRWSGQPPAAQRRPAEWARTLNAQQQDMTRNRTRGAPSSAGGTMLWGTLMMLMAWSIPGYIALQIYMLVKYRGRWRKLALLPLWGTVPLFAYTLFALAAGSNLWPLLLLFLAPFAFIYLLIIGWVKRKSNQD